MKILITGSRYWQDQIAIEKILALYKVKNPIIIHGGCKGADLQADAAARSLGYEVRFYLPDWDKYGRSAGILRNQEMLDKEHVPNYPIEVCIAFHKDIGASKGTKDMIERCKKYSIPVILYP